MSPTSAIMSARVSNFRSAWEDRWSEPTADELLDAIESPSRPSLDKLVEGLEGLEGIEQGVSWYGEAWKWTVEYRLAANGNGEGNGEGRTACYVIPNVETPLVCIPLEAPVLERLPIRRLSRVVREGIRSAKCAVSIHWAIWRPTSKVEAEALTDLVKRKIKISKELSPPDEADSASGNGGTKRGRKGSSRGKSGR